MENLPINISIVYAIATFITVYLFYKAANNSKTTLIIILTWMGLQSLVTFSGFYETLNTLPPRFLLLPGPPILFIVLLFLTSTGRKFLDSLSLQYLTLMNLIRIPVEFVLLWLFLNKAVPQIMTFEGRNLDILSGISAAVIYYFVFIKKLAGQKALLIWNIACLGLLVNIVSIAILSLPAPFQKFGFEQPNIALPWFPFIWLPCCVVPLVLLSHLAGIRQLVMSMKKVGTKALV